VKITADTNVLVRAVIGDDAEQAKVAGDLLRQAETIAVTMPALCEFVWVLSRGYKIPAIEIAVAIRRLIDSSTVEVERAAVEAGLNLLEAGGDFADGVIAFEGRRLGGAVFASFDADAVRRIRGSGGETRLLSTK